MIHTPYGGAHKPFTIGLKPLPLRDWIDVDGNLGSYLTEKHRLYAEEWREVYATTDGTAAGQEVLDLLVEYLPDRFPDSHGLKDGKVVPKHFLGLRRDDDAGLDALAIAGLLVPTKG